MLHVKSNIAFIWWNAITSNFLFYVFHFYKMFLLAISVNFLYLALCSHIANIFFAADFCTYPQEFFWWYCEQETLDVYQLLTYLLYLAHFLGHSENNVYSCWLLNKPCKETVLHDV